jgi:uncharacterized membrane protein YtjA (UPF0391 family)
MLQLTLVFFVFILLDSLIGFSGPTAAAAEMARVLFCIFSLLLALSLLATVRDEFRHKAERK